MMETCDYHKIKKEYNWILEKNRKVVISPDLDGILSSVLFSHLLKARVVGVYSLNEIWLAKKYLIFNSSSIEELIISNNLLFLDHDINREEIPSIGHHILQWSHDCCSSSHLKNYSLNPNLLRKITRKEFKYKYPFSTFHFLLACFSAWGYLEKFEYDEDILTLFLHIDSSFENAIKYQDNAFFWLEWLGGSEKNSPLYFLCKKLLKFHPALILKQFKKLADLFFSFGLKPRSQAVFSNPCGGEYQKIINLLEWFKDKTGICYNLVKFPEEEMMRIRLIRKSTSPIKKNFKEVIKKNPFSYAIISLEKMGINYNFFKS